MAVEDNSAHAAAIVLEESEPTLLDQWRFERRVIEPEVRSDWRSAVPAELFERLRARSAAAAIPGPAPVTASIVSLPLVIEGAAAGVAPLPETYRAPFLPRLVAPDEPFIDSTAWESDAELLPEEAAAVELPSSFLGLDWSPSDNSGRVLVGVRPILDAAMADRVAELLDLAPGMSAVRSLGSTGDVAAFEADYDGPVPGMEAVSQALRSIGASLVSTGDREFYLAIQGQAV